MASTREAAVAMVTVEGYIDSRPTNLSYRAVKSLCGNLRNNDH
jgi:hypothetical protein